MYSQVRYHTDLDKKKKKKDKQDFYAQSKSRITAVKVILF